MTRLMTLLSMAVDGVGPSQTCSSLLAGMARVGLSGPLYATRVSAGTDGLEYNTVVPSPLNAIPYRLIAKSAMHISERRFLKDLRDGDIAYLWPNASLRAYEAAKKTGISVVGEGINTRMASARAVLDAAYEAEGLVPEHGLTDARIADEEAKLAMTDYFFAPSPSVEKALVGSNLPNSAVIPVSYGVDLSRTRARSERRSVGARPIFLFVGWGSIRKGLHQLLRGWVEANVQADLWIAGTLEPALERLCRPLLERDDVHLLGFTRDVDGLYAQADVFVLPSFEEGDPLVTYEAAVHGLPIIASPMGAGRMGNKTSCVRQIDPADTESIALALYELAGSEELRMQWAKRSATAVLDYGWNDVAERRASFLRAKLSTEA